MTRVFVDHLYVLVLGLLYISFFYYSPVGEFHLDGPISIPSLQAEEMG